MENKGYKNSLESGLQAMVSDCFFAVNSRDGDGFMEYRSTEYRLLGY